MPDTERANAEKALGQQARMNTNEKELKGEEDRIRHAVINANGNLAGATSQLSEEELGLAREISQKVRGQRGRKLT